MGQKIALVTGGSRGLGKDMALALAKKGIDVVITYNTQKELAEKVVEEIVSMERKAVAIPFDAADVKGLDGFMTSLREVLQQHWGSNRFDFLIHNAGVGATIPMANVTEEDFDRLLNIHYKTVYFLTQQSIPYLNDGGGIIFISSGTTRYCVPGYSVYSSLKGAIEVLSKFVAKDLGPRGIRSNVVAPGPIETDFNNAAIRSNQQMKAHLTNMTPLGRVGMADDVGAVVAFLCTDDAKWVNAQRIEVSGGINI